ncbi:MAG: tRNA pseudouridine(38-40) synthase TruA [Candidatus Hydrogenedentota bacterium]
MTRRIALLLEYDGTDFVGWQAQTNGRSVQVVIESSIKEVFHETTRIVGAGRTDSGVHAFGQVAHFDIRHGVPADKVREALNTKLPKDVSVRSSAEVAPGFHARRDARKKRYRYLLCDGSHQPVLDRRTMAHTPWHLDVAAMNEAAQHWIGKHDFDAFRAARCQAENSVRSIDRIKVERVPASRVASVSPHIDPILFTFEGRSFLHHQVRNMVGTLVEIGRGAEKVEWAKEILKGLNREDAGRTMPAHGLVLDAIEYKADPFAG